MAALAAAAGALVLAGAAGAQDASKSTGDAQAVVAGTAQLITQLHLTPPQQAALLAYFALLTDPAAQPHPDLAAYRAMTLPQQLDYAAGQAAADMAILKTRADAARRFYDLLTPDQRKAYDAINSPPMTEAMPPNDVAEVTRQRLDRRLPSHTDPDWQVKPTAEQVWRVYPRDARLHNVAGSAQLNCWVNTDGYLYSCTVSDEAPKNAGFAGAALEVAAFMRMNPATNFGVPVESQVNVPVNFQP